MREVIDMAKGTPGDTGGLRGLLSLDDHPDLHDVFQNGDIEDDYDVEKEPIARGKFASVRRARHQGTGQVFAAKYIRRRRRNVSLEGEARHEVAVLLLGRRDPHIVRLHQVYQTRTEYIILLEFAGGGDLQRLLDEAVSLPECEVRALLQQVLRGLAFLHTNTIAHLDIKPQNLVMMGDSPEEGVKLVDFGLSRVITQGTEIREIMGTADYLAPEVINFEPLTLATDMWAVGVLTYVFLTSCTPFGGDSDQETFVKITQGDFDFPDDLFAEISDEAKDFICGLLVKKPSDRMTVDDCLNHTWMTTPLPTVLPSILKESYEDTETEEPSDYHNGFDAGGYSSSFSTGGDHLYPLPETDHVDSAYSSDSSSSPTLTEGYTSLVVPPLCQCTIPEGQQLQHHHKQKRQQIPVGSSATLGRRPRSKGHRLSIDMEDSFRSQYHPMRATRRASLVMDDPRYLHEAHHIHEIERPLGEVPRPLIEEGVLTRDSDVDSGVSCHDCEESRVENPRFYHSDSYDGGDAASVISWDDYADMGGRRPSLTQYDQATLSSVTRPWDKLCNGSVSRALIQLTEKKVPKNSELRGSKADLRGSKVDLRGSRSDLHSSKSDLRVSKADLRASKSDLRASKSDLRASKCDIRASKAELRASKADLRASLSRQDLRASKSDLRASRSDLRASKSDLRASKSDLRASKSDLRASKSELRASRNDLRASRTDLRGSRSNLTLSRLDLAHETLDDNCVLEDESEDIVRGDLLQRRENIDRSTLAPFMHGNSLHMSFRMPKRKDMRI